MQQAGDRPAGGTPAGSDPKAQRLAQPTRDGGHRPGVEHLVGGTGRLAQRRPGQEGDGVGASGGVAHRPVIDQPFPQVAHVVGERFGTHQRP